MVKRIVSIRYWYDKKEQEANLLVKIQGTEGDTKDMYDRIRKLEQS